MSPDEMKVFIQSQNGEDGPYSLPELRRRFEQGKLPEDPSCRIDGTEEVKPLLQQFPELAPVYDNPEEEAHEKRRAQRRKKRIRTIVGGGLLFATGIGFLFTPRPMKGVIMAIGGLILFVHGCVQNPSGRSRVRERRNSWDGSRQKEAERTAPRNYDY